MNTVSYSEGNNVGGVREILMAFFGFFTTLNPVTFKPGYGWTNMEFLPDAASCKYTAADDDNGTTHSYSLVFGFNKQSVAMYNAFAQYTRQTGICKFTDNNGLTLILGTLKNRVTIKQEGDTGAAPTNANDFKITLTWANRMPAQIV